MKLKLSVIGLGKLGSSMAAVFADKGFRVIGLDINRRAVDLLNRGLPLDQKDSDSLPPYDVLDQILCDYVPLGDSLGEIEAKGFDAETVHRVIDSIDRSEYKRRQSAPGVKVTQGTFGKDWRVPITHRYKS